LKLGAIHNPDESKGDEMHSLMKKIGIIGMITTGEDIK
jgi:hypothetical protein